jgi:hypothetical protein
LNYAIVRLYATAQQAADAVGRLKSAHFAADLINLVGPPGASGHGASPAGASAASIAAAIAARYVLNADAEFYAQAVLKGQWLVSVLAAYGQGGEAMWILEQFDPLPIQPWREKDHVKLWDDAAPLSSAFWLPVLSKEVAPISRMFGARLLSKKGNSGSFSGTSGVPLITKGPFFPTGIFPLIIRKAR